METDVLPIAIRAWLAHDTYKHYRRDLVRGRLAAVLDALVAIQDDHLPEPIVVATMPIYVSNSGHDVHLLMKATEALHLMAKLWELGMEICLDHGPQYPAGSSRLVVSVRVQPPRVTGGPKSLEFTAHTRTFD